MNKKREVIERGNIFVENDMIKAVGKKDTVNQKTYPSEIVLDARHKAVLPGLINTHAHFFQTLLKSLGDDKDLFGWLASTTQPAAPYYRPKDMYWSSLTTCIESIKSGITTTCDMQYLHTTPQMTYEACKAVKDSGIRGIISRQNSDADRFSKFPAKRKVHWEPLDVYLSNTEKAYNEWHGKANGRIEIWAGPNTIFSCSDDLIQKVTDWTEKHGLRQFIHLSETKWEFEQIKKHVNSTPLQALWHIDPRAVSRGIMVHAIWMTPKDLRLLAKHGGAVSHNTTSNMFLASGVAPVPEMLRLKIPVSLGTDGAASNNTNNLWEMLKLTALLHKVHTLQPTSMAAEQVLEMATIMGARAIGKESQIGSIEPEKKADLILVNLDSINYSPLNRVVSQLVYCGQASDVDTVIINGQIVMQGRKMSFVDEKSAMLKTQEAVDDLIARAGLQKNREIKWPLT
ncbi:MAG: amidohydrolase family protein [Candidatus Ranarchaeia archaeon]